MSPAHNDYNWPKAREHQYQALIKQDRTAREEELGEMLFALGHIIHLNQDMSHPDHVRNDEHAARRYLEDFGEEVYLKTGSFPQIGHGWSWWRAQGFLKLLHFWDRGKYLSGSAAALEADASGTSGEKLGLAEFANGNFLSEDAIYAEFWCGAGHRFPLPSLANTDQRQLKGPSWWIDSTTLPNGKSGPCRYISKLPGAGVPVVHHSVLKYLAALHPPKSALPGMRVALSVNDANVMMEYYDKLIPKAIEYSAGILDYFFRGQLGALAYRTNSGTIFLEVTNTSGQRLSGGTFEVYADASGTRSSVGPLQAAWGSTETLADGATRDFTFPEPTPPPTNYVVVYQGTIGTLPGPPYTALDSVDAPIAVAAKNFQLVEKIEGQVIAKHFFGGHPPFQGCQIHEASQTLGVDPPAIDPWIAHISNWLSGGNPVDPALQLELDYNAITGESDRRYLQLTITSSGGYERVLRSGKHSSYGGEFPNAGRIIYDRITSRRNSDGESETYEWGIGDDGNYINGRTERPNIAAYWTPGDVASAAAFGDPPDWPPAHYVVTEDLHAEVTADGAYYENVLTADGDGSPEGEGLPQLHATLWFRLQLQDGWGLADIQAELDSLLSKVNLSDAGREYPIEGETTRALLEEGESITVTHEGPSAGQPLRYVYTSNGAWNWESKGPCWLACNLNEITEQGIEAWGEGGVPTEICEMDVMGGVGLRWPWMAMKSAVRLPAGSYAQTEKSYRQPAADTRSWCDYWEADPTLFPNGNAGGEVLLPDSERAVSGNGKVKIFTRGGWITITKLEADGE